MLTPLLKIHLQEIQKKEAALWLELKIYDSTHAPITMNRDARFYYDCNDAERQKHLHAWNAVYELMETLGIGVDYELSDHKWAGELDDELYQRRKAAGEIVVA